MKIRRANLGQTGQNCGTNPCSAWDTIQANTPFGLFGNPSAPCLSYIQCSDPVLYADITGGFFAGVGAATGSAVSSTVSGFSSQQTILSTIVLAVAGLAVVAIVLRG